MIGRQEFKVNPRSQVRAGHGSDRLLQKRRTSLLLSPTQHKLGLSAEQKARASENGEL